MRRTPAHGQRDTATHLTWLCCQSLHLMLRLHCTEGRHAMLLTKACACAATAGALDPSSQERCSGSRSLGQLNALHVLGACKSSVSGGDGLASPKRLACRGFRRGPTKLEAGAHRPELPARLRSAAHDTGLPIAGWKILQRAQWLGNVFQTLGRNIPFGWLQETEKGMLFAQKSRWKDLTRGIRQHVATVGTSLSLWKTSIQTIEARHGEQRLGRQRLCMLTLGVLGNSPFKLSRSMASSPDVSVSLVNCGACCAQDPMSR